MGQMPNRKFAEEIISNMKGSTLTNDGHGNRNGGLSFAPWMANQSFESNLLSKTQEIASTHMNTTLQNIKSNALLQRSEPDVSPYLKDLPLPQGSVSQRQDKQSFKEEECDPSNEPKR